MKFLNLLLAARLAVAATIVVSDQQAGWEGSKAIDGNTGTFWHSTYSPSNVPLPHTATIDLGSTQLLNGFNYLPRQDGNANGRIGQYTLEVSTNNVAWTQVASGTWIDDPSKKHVGFPNTNVRYLRLTAITEAGNRGPWTSAAEFGVNVAPAASANGQWGPIITLPLVAAAAFLIPTSGNILTFSADNVISFGGSGNTWTATYNPSTGAVSTLNVQNTAHDMFCPGISLDANGRAIVTGGDDEQKTSIYVASSNSWISAANMQIARGYQSTATCSDGRIFNIGGSWSGGYGGKNGEIYNPATNTWTLLPGCPVAPMLTNDAQGIFRQDNHAWLFGWKSGYVFQAGPSSAMNWYGTSGTGSQTSAGLRASDPDSMDGNAVMYDAVAGKIVTFGGSPNYQNSAATNRVHLITLGTPPAVPTVTQLASMTYSRAFANAVVLPNGKVFVTGGQSYAVPFTDTTAILTPELWDPVTQTLTTLPAETVPRTYHSVALLMLDGRVFSSGGGLCGNTCGTNHFDAQIFSPPYLFNANGSPATRPVISAISTAAVQVGNSFTVTTTSAVTRFALVRYGSSTHTVNTDQRRIPLTPTATAGNTYTLQVPSDSGVALPGYWMVFVMNSAGTPSVARSIRIYT